jgi:hypothetical protein
LGEQSTSARRPKASGSATSGLRSITFLPTDTDADARAAAEEARWNMRVTLSWFGDLEHPRVLKSMELFAREVMPAFA